ncbi:MAG TPA: hypothetical protein VLT87_25820 [Thermoanaerobaculia bacterium]|nr:hypothetical protein [Thermoanaerobaculia bacterium]
MIVVPSAFSLPEARLYRDSADPQQLYLDVLRGAPLTGPDPVRWLPVPAQTAYLVGEVRFGPDVEDFDRARQQPEVPPGARLLPMPWESGPVFLWARQGEEGALRVAEGKTSGFGPSNAVLTGTAPPATMASPLMIAAELAGRARLGGVRLRGGGRAEALRQGLAEAPVGDRAVWSATLGDALLSMLERLLEEGALTLDLEVAGDAPPEAPAIAGLRTLALLEWARRIAEAAGAGSLALPASHFADPRSAAASAALELDWHPGDTVPLRAVRVVCPGGANAPVTGIPLQENRSAE